MTVVITEAVPTAAPDGRRLLVDAAQAAERDHARLNDVMADIFLPDAHRASDHSRAVTIRLFDQLLREVEGDLRAILSPRFEQEAPDVAAVLASDREPIATPILRAAGLLHDGELIGLLLRRAEEHRIILGLRRIAEAGLEPAGRPAEIADDAAAAADRALRIAENTLADAMHEPMLAARDLPPAVFRRLTWRLAAGVRDYLVRNHGIDSVVADQHVSAAGSALVDAHGQEDSLETAAMRLARRWRALGVDDDRRLHHALCQGRLALFAAVLSARGAVGYSTAVAIAADRDIARLAVLLRAVAVERDVAVSILFEMAAIHGLDEQRLLACAEGFSRLDPTAAREATDLTRLDHDYHDAVAELAAGAVTQ